MGSKESIIPALRSAAPQLFEKPDLSALKADSLRCPDLVEGFCRAVASSGGKTAFLEGDPATVARSFFPDTDDIAVVPGHFGVAENGCVYLEEPEEGRRLDYFVHEALVIVLDRKEIVANMHDAYDRIGETVTGYGIFISGPSKTADIEQALVFGAHGAREVGIFLK